ncbi:TonB-dependent receptor [Sphingosinicella sp. YJ22]|uniref:TonB-dependent receptor domain-containing protein n=1 Tax=Sphingosinicella sp. YJ22 TaxID=1104780 RepID=UPI00140C869B|nr:TonB-dependent receptor [Sphingosinicella sp. YJ22]
MTKTLTFGSLLLLSTALCAPAALAQTGASTAPDAPEAAPVDEDQAEAPLDQIPGEEVEVSIPGGGVSEDVVVVTGQRANLMRRTPQVISLLSQEDIERTGEGDIAGALQRVTGLSVVGNGFVYVRGLGDRYSLALLNGSPLPSPEPLRRVVPLDIFPTSLIASSLVQKTFSANFPGEFGGGVINLTTRAIPDESFLEIGASLGGDTETTFNLGYTYYGSDTDWTGFDDGTRDAPAGLIAAAAGGSFNTATTPEQRRRFAMDLVNSPTMVLQTNRQIPANVSANIAAGTAIDFGADARIGLIANLGYSNSWRTRDTLQQSSLDPELAGTPQRSFDSVITDNRIVVNGLLGVGLEFGEHRIRWTNLFIRDTLKQGRLGAGFNRNVTDQDPDLPPSLIEQNSYWFERQLIDTQLVAELDFGDFEVDLRGTYAKSQRQSPYEREIGYAYRGDGDPGTVSATDVDDYVNDLTSGGQFATIAFSDLDEDVLAGGIDLSYRLPSLPVTVSAGYAYSQTERTASRFQFQYFRPDGALPIEIAQQRPDFLLSDFNVQTFDIQLRDVSGAEGAASYDARLDIHGVYGQVDATLFEGLTATAGVRFESADQSVMPVGTLAPTALSADYLLPALTLTYAFAADMQARLHASRTIARPQFRELAPQLYQGFESDREFTGNPFLQDSELTNLEARYEWYFAPSQRVSASAFYKQIDNPIEAAAFFAGGGQLRTGFANAPRAELYGAEIELQKHVPLDGLGGPFFDTRRLLLIANYTYTQSQISADDSVIVGPDLQPVEARLLFRDGAPLTGQSDHLVNVQIGIEDSERLSQATILLNYASERVTSRGPIQGSARQPDIVERPGLRVDFVARQAVPLGGVEAELQLEARNLFGQDYREVQEFGDNLVSINSYDVGTSFSLGLNLRF